MKRGLSLSSIKASAIKHKPTILDVASALSGIAAIGLAWYGGLKSSKLLEDAKAAKDKKMAEETGVISVEGAQLTIAEKAAVTARYWGPVLITGLFSLGSGYIGARELHKRNTALAASAAGAELALSNYISKTKELIGEKKEQKIRDEVIQQEVASKPVQSTEVVITGAGNTLCYDNLTGRYFKSDMEKIRRGLNNLNRILLRQDYVSLNEFYDEVGLPRTETGDYLGWNNNGDKNYELNCAFTSHLTSDGAPCLVIAFEDQPRYDYDRFCY